MIRELTSEQELRRTAQLIRDAFATVACEQELTRETCPSHPAFVDDERVLSMARRGTLFYGLFEDAEQVGAVALTRLDEPDWEIEKLAVPPACRHRGFGRRLVEHACGAARSQGARRVVLGMVDDNTALKEWYLGMGFTVESVRRYEHLPFEVCRMEKRLR